MQLTKRKINNMYLIKNVADWIVAVFCSPFVVALATYLAPSEFLHLGIFLLTTIDFIACIILIFKTGKDKLGNDAVIQSKSFNPTLIKLASYHSILIVVMIYETIFLPTSSLHLTTAVAGVIASKELISCIENFSKISGNNILVDIKAILLKYLPKKDDDKKEDK